MSNYGILPEKRRSKAFRGGLNVIFDFVFTRMFQKKIRVEI
jgi:hypothetical protein